MRLNKIEIQNFRLIGDQKRIIAFPSNTNVNIFIGDNGSGKTSLLDSIAFMLSPFMSQFPRISDRLFSGFDIHIRKDGRLAPYISIEADFESIDGISIHETRTRRGTGKAPESDLKEMKSYANGLLKSILDGEKDIPLPVFAYYGTGRGMITAPERKRNFQKIFERWDCYNNALTPSTDFKSFFAWFDLMEDEERRGMQKRKDFDYRSPALECVRRALSNFVGDDFVNPRIETHPLRFVMSDKSGKRRQLRIEQLSDGYKIIIAMVADIASRMAEANPWMENPLDSTGIILIDEIDLHLHPKWQRVVAEQLTKTFPNIQFILSTHSPIIVAGASSFSKIEKLKTCEGLDQDSIDFEDSTEAWNHELDTLDIGQILLSELFGLESLRSPEWDSMLARRNELLSKSELSEEERRELNTLETSLSKLQNGNSLLDIETNRLLTVIADKLGVR